jgi:hypothetical protein
MTGIDNRFQRKISRRRLIEASVVIGGTAAIFAARSTAEAQSKMSQQAAKYQSEPKNGQRCSGCALFEPPSACKVVEGSISPNGWCQLFAAKQPS